MKVADPAEKSQVLRSERKVRKDYVQILRRCSENHGSIPVADRDPLATIMQVLDLSKETLRRDYKIVHHIEKLKGQADGEVEARKRYDAAFRAMEDFKARLRRRNDGHRHLEEQNRLTTEVRQAAEKLGTIQMAAKELKQLREKYPALFQA